MRLSPLRPLAVLAVGCVIGGCGKASPSQSLIGGPSATSVPAAAGVVGITTKNTTRIGGADPETDAAAVAWAVYPGLTAGTRPQAVVIVDKRDWPAALAASVLASAPLGAPILYADGSTLPAITVLALEKMRPLGAPALGGAQVIRVGTNAALPGGYRAQTVPAGYGPAGLAARVQKLLRVIQGKPPGQVIAVVLGAAQSLQMPAAGLAAESGAPVLEIGKREVPPATSAVLRHLRHPAIYLIGAGEVSAPTVASLQRFGRVVVVAGGTPAQSPPPGGEGVDPVENAVSVSRFADGPFGWGIHEAGHGLVFALASRPLDAPAAAPLSAHGDYGPLLLLAGGTSVPSPLAHYLSDIEPGYTPTVNPVREVYNHGWLIGDERAISAHAQAELDAILEVAPRTPSPAEQAPPPPE